MRRTCLLCAALVCFAVSFNAFSEEIVWRSDFDSAFSEAKAADKLVMMDVYTDWCGWCKKLDEDTYSNRAVVAFAKGFVSLKFNPEEARNGDQVTLTYAIQGYPAILFLDSSRELVGRIDGYLPPDDFLTAMKTAASNRLLLQQYAKEAALRDYRNTPAYLELLSTLARRTELKVLFDNTEVSKRLSAADRAFYAFQIGLLLMDNEDYPGVLPYIALAEDLKPATEATWNAITMHAIVLYHTEGKPSALVYLDNRLKDSSVPAEWKEHYRDIRSRLESAP